MDTSDSPPLVLDSARVVAFAIVDASVQWTGRQRVFADGELLGPVPRLAICQNVFDDDFFLLFCDSGWGVLGATSGRTEEELKTRAERWYRGIAQKWKATNVTREAAAEALQKRDARESCSFCGRLPVQVEAMFSSAIEGSEGSVHICSVCIEKMHKLVQSAS